MGWFQDAGGAISNAAKSIEDDPLAAARSAGGAISNAAKSVANGGELPSMGSITGSTAKQNAQDAVQSQLEKTQNDVTTKNAAEVKGMKDASDKYATDVSGIEKGATDKTNSIYGGYEQARNPITAAKKQANNSYAATVGGIQNQFASDQTGLQQQAAGQAKDAHATYTNDIQPTQKNLMERAAGNAGQAMSLSDYGNVNNATQTGVRDMYNTQAQNEGQRGLAASGVLASLGAQATANAGGNGVPMTGSQLQLLGANNQAQAGQAYAATQQRMNSLRDQGIAQGFAQYDKVYSAGQAAQGQASNMAGAYQQGVGTDINQQQGLRGEQGAYGANIASAGMTRSGTALNAAQANAGYDTANLNQDTNFNIGQTNTAAQQAVGVAGLQNQSAQNAGALNMGINNNLAGYQNAATGMQNANNTANNAANAAITGSILGAAGTMAGAAIGAPAPGVASQMLTPTEVGYQSFQQPQMANPYNPNGSVNSNFNPMGPGGVQNQMMPA